MGFVPFDRMRQRVERAMGNSDTEYFDGLLLWGELLTKIVTGGMVAAIENEQDRLRYRQIHRIVRATGIGEWTEVLDDTLTGPPAQFLQAAREEQQLLTEKKPPSWALDATRALHAAALTLTPDLPAISPNPSLREWFRIFAHLRNKTRGHGAQGADVRAAAAPRLRESVEAIVERFPLFQRPWAYLHRNLSGKYRVSPMTPSSGRFDDLRSRSDVQLLNGVYVDLDRVRLVELLRSDSELADFFCPNGGFNGRRFELLSYISGAMDDADASPYLESASELPPSETKSLGTLEVVGEVFSNLPPRPQGFIRREGLERELKERLLDDRHQIVTLHGPGGIGKTSLALEVLYDVAQTQKYSAIVWFSARDIDLAHSGPKPVKPDVVNELVISREYARLVAPHLIDKGFKPIEFMTSEMAHAETGPTLYVFDNFETVTSQIDLFKWLDASIRPPNKILITTRFREFNGDYVVEVRGMEEDESERLISATAESLGVSAILDPAYRRKLHEESEGHPYVIKVLLGAVAKERRKVDIPRLAASREDILTALFERTYTNLDPGARRVFLTLCSWRSWIPTLGLSAVLLREANSERIDVERALEVLQKSSLIELRSEADAAEFVQAPLVASVFGLKKLRSDPMKGAVEADMKLLQAFGPAQETDLRHGVEPHVRKLFALASEAIARSRDALARYLPVLEFVAQRHPPAWEKLGSLHAEEHTAEGSREAIAAWRRFIEEAPANAKRIEAWRGIGFHAEKLRDTGTALHAWSELAQDRSATLVEVSEAANHINGILHDFKDATYDRRAIVRPVISAFEKVLGDASGTDWSRLAWLHLNIQDDASARAVVTRALAADFSNEHLVKLAKRLEIEGV